MAGMVLQLPAVADCYRAATTPFPTNPTSRPARSLRFVEKAVGEVVLVAFGRIF